MVVWIIVLVRSPFDKWNFLFWFLRRIDYNTLNTSAMFEAFNFTDTFHVMRLANCICYLLRGHVTAFIWEVHLYN